MEFDYNDPNIIRNILTYYDLTIVDEKKNKFLVFLVGLSGKLPEQNRMSALLISESSAGKSFVATTVLKDFNTFTLAEMSPSVLKYMIEEIEHSDVLYIKELRNFDNEESPFRLLSAEDGGFEFAVTVKEVVTDKKGNSKERFVAHKGKIPVIPIVSTTTRINVDVQQLNRSLVLSLDESHEQTMRIIKKEEIFNRYGFLANTFQSQLEVSRQNMKKFLNNFPKDINVVLSTTSYIKQFAEKNKLLRIRRDIKKITNINSLITALHWKQRPYMVKDGKKYIFSIPQDAYYTVLFTSDLLSNFDEYSIKEKKILHILYNATQKSQPDEYGNIQNGLSLREIMRESGFQQYVCQKLLNQLISKNVVDVYKHSKENRYQITDKQLVHQILENKLTLTEDIELDIIQTSKEFFDSIAVHPLPDEMFKIYKVNWLNEYNYEKLLKDNEVIQYDDINISTFNFNLSKEVCDCTFCKR